ncbi:MAG TPA: DUF3108 domain-containing protein [Candidatus Acidoferrales bacterium]|nr:DUF3108 domain-containing protein [Candidatus Acidoferrales bacterium]
MGERETRIQLTASAPDNRRPIVVFGIVLLVVILALLDPTWLRCAAPTAAWFPQHSTVKQRATPALDSKQPPAPFRAGETLNYRVSWSVFSNAASLELSAPEHRELFGREAWHFRGVAHTLNSVRSLFPIDDQFDSYADSATLESRQFETQLNEMGRSTHQVLHFAPTGKPSSLPPPIVVVPLGTRDPLGAVYALRDVDWHRTPDFRAPVYDGRDIYEIRASRESSDESVKVAAGAYLAWRISIRLFQSQKEVSSVHYVMWIASDAARTPILMEADLPFGTIRAELTSRS